MAQGGQTQVWPEDEDMGEISFRIAEIIPASNFAHILSLSGAQEHRNVGNDKQHKQEHEEQSNINIQALNHNNDNNPRNRSMVTDTSSRCHCRWKHWKFIAPSLILLLIIIVLLFDLALKPDTLDIDHNWVTMREFKQSSIPINNSSSANSSAVWEFVVDVVLVVSNPNLSGRFSYYNAGSFMFYDGRVVGRSSIDPGSVPTQRSRNISSSLSARIDNNEESSSILNLSAETNMTGYVRKWGILCKHYAISSLCGVVVSPRNESLVGYSCHSK